MQGTRVPSLVWEDRTYPEATKRESHSYWAYMPKGDALQQEKPPQWEAPHTTKKSSPPTRNLPELQKWELDYKESWERKNWWFWTVVLEKTLESPLDCEEIQPVHPKGDQSWIFIGRTDAEDEAPILWPPDMKNWLIGKDPDAGKDWRQEEKGTTEDEMVGWHHQLNGHEFE